MTDHTPLATTTPATDCSHPHHGDPTHHAIQGHDYARELLTAFKAALDNNLHKAANHRDAAEELLNNYTATCASDLTALLQGTYYELDGLLSAQGVPRKTSPAAPGPDG